MHKNDSKDFKLFRKFLKENEEHLIKLGILFLSFSQWKQNKLPYYCCQHKEFKLISKASFKKSKRSLDGVPCFKCGKEKAAKLRLKTLTSFIQESRLIFGDKYDYSLSEYSGSKNNIVLICKEHGKFLQRVEDHLYGCEGCKTCSPSSGYSSNKAGKFYIVLWEHDCKSFIKFGITNSSVKTRISKQKHRISGIKFEPKILRIFEFESGKIPNLIEAAVKSNFKTNIIDKKDFPDGYTETLKTENLDRLLRFVEDFIIQNVDPELVVHSSIA